MMEIVKLNRFLGYGKSFLISGKPQRYTDCNESSTLCRVREVVKPKRNNFSTRESFQTVVSCPIARELPKAELWTPLVRELARRP